jgi:DNA-binding Xre family transcriptional regulator
MRVDEAIGIRLVNLCFQKNMLTEDLIENCALGRTRIQNILTAKAHRITTDEVAALCHALKMDVADFFQDDIFKDAVA